MDSGSNPSDALAAAEAALALNRNYQEVLKVELQNIQEAVQFNQDLHVSFRFSFNHVYLIDFVEKIGRCFGGAKSTASKCEVTLSSLPTYRC